MSRYIFIIALTILGLNAGAQEPDSIFAVRKGANLAVKYISKPEETVAMIAHRFYMPEDKIEGLSGVDGRKKIPAGTELYIPLNSLNYNASKEPIGIENQEQVFYHVKEKDNIPLISIYAGIKKDELILWNSLHGNTLKEGQPLFVGWVKMVPHDAINMQNGLAYPATGKVTVASVHDTEHHAFGEMDSLYNVQTRNGTSTLTEKGTAVFFEKTGKNNIYYAFHNTTLRGTVIKVTNPGTGKYIYAKVLGPLPDTKLYANSIIGICNAAKDALGVMDNKAWCELSYSAN